MKVTVSAKGQMTIPKALRDRLAIRPGQVLELQQEGGRIVVTKIHQTDPVDSVYGILPAEPTTDAFIDSVRGEPEAI